MRVLNAMVSDDRVLPGRLLAACSRLWRARLSAPAGAVVAVALVTIVRDNPRRRDLRTTVWDCER